MPETTSRPKPTRVRSRAGAARPSPVETPRLWPYLLLLLLACLLCWPVFAGRIMVPGDNLIRLHPWTGYKAAFHASVPQNEMLDPVQQYLPWRHLAVWSVRAGVIPLWNPYSYCGAPFLANLQSAVLYPPNALFLLTGPGRGFGPSAILHLLLGGIAMFGFLRALRLGPPASATGAVIFMLNGFTVAWLEYPTLSLWPAMWLPLILWMQELAVARRQWAFTVACGVAIGLSLLGGHVQVSAYVLIALGLYTLVRAATLRACARPLLSLVLALVVGVGLSAGQLLPSLELARNSLRAAPDPHAALSTALPWTHLVIYLMPRFFGSPATHNYWGRHDHPGINFFETSGYVGVLALLLAIQALVCGRAAQPEAAIVPRATGWRRFLRRMMPGFPTSFFLLVALVALLVALGTPLYYVAYRAVPGMGQFRGLARIMYLAAFALAGLAAVGLETLTRDAHRAPTWPTLTMTGVLLAFAVVITLRFHHLIGELGVGRYVIMQWVVFGALVVVSSSLLLLRGRGVLTARGFARLAVIIVSGDLLIAGVGFNPAVDARLDFPPTATTDYLQAHLGADRMTSIGPSAWTIMPPNTPLAYRLRDVHGYDSLVPANYESMLMQSCQNEQFRWPRPDGVFPRVAAVRYLVTVFKVVDPHWGFVRRDGQVAIYENRTVPPRAYLAEAQAGAPTAAGLGTVAFREDSLNRVRLAAENTREARLILSDTAYPGWRPLVDGRPAEPAPAPWVFRAVRLPPGRHEVEWRYDPASFRVGLFVSLLLVAALAGAAALWVNRGPAH